MPIDRAYDLADRLSKLDRLDRIEDFAPAVLAIMANATWDAFVRLDEQPGLYGGSDCYSWFYMLRQVRNHPVYGRRMFDGFAGRKRGD